MKSTLLTPAHEEHMLSDIRLYNKLLSNLDLTNVTVLEFGAGDGVLTEIILDQNPKKIIAYEFSEILADKLKMRLDSPLLDLRVADFTKEDFSYLEEGQYVVISNPPYSTIQFLQEKVIQPYRINDVIMMTSSTKKQKYFSDYEVAFSLEEKDFSPPARGNHFVMQKGFNALMKTPAALPLIPENHHYMR
ncbi:MAG: rRNA adenine N-6-methyltransferase family protein [Gammaproteobacteria bacterium]|nr:rRNA adenine N-6-methyltransferase family protein [Gammaproteobacteria bacterium]